MTALCISATVEVLHYFEVLFHKQFFAKILRQQPFHHVYNNNISLSLAQRVCDKARLDMISGVALTILSQTHYLITDVVA